jgi:RNA polymerase sigma-70 factor (ECF subfamily)
MNRDQKQVFTEWLVLSAQAGTETAFKDLHDLWSADLRRFALSRVEKPEAADEVVNDCWLAIARGLARLDDPACFPRWAFRIVERRAADWVRQRSLQRRREIAAANESDLLAPAGSPAAPADHVLKLREAVSQLATDDRELVQLYYVLERSVAEIAEVLAVPAGTVKSRLFSVRESLKQILNPNSHE